MALHFSLGNRQFFHLIGPSPEGLANRQRVTVRASLVPLADWLQPLGGVADPPPAPRINLWP